MKKNHWVYILLCNNGNYYTGYTSDLRRRWQEHLSGSPKCKYTRSFKPLKLAQCWRVKTGKSLAMKIECFIKKLSKQKKEALILNPRLLTRAFPCKIETLIS